MELLLIAWTSLTARDKVSFSQPSIDQLIKILVCHCLKIAFRLTLCTEQYRYISLGQKHIIGTREMLTFNHLTNQRKQKVRNVQSHVMR